MTDNALALQLLAAAQRYHDLARWCCELFLIMPDHVHFIAAFPSHHAMSTVVKDWKRGTATFQGLRWQDNYFDHRLRGEREANEAWWYIRRNPVVKGLCLSEGEWPWWIAPARREGGAC